MNEFLACLTTWGAALGAVLVLAIARAVLQMRAEPSEPNRYPVGRDALHPPMPARPVPPVVAYTPVDRTAHDQAVRDIWQPNPMRDTLIVARPLGWDGQPRTKEYEL